MHRIVFFPFFLISSLIIALTPLLSKAQSTVLNHYVQKLDPKDLEGKWYLNMSTSKTWTHTKIKDVTFTFQPGTGYWQEDIAYLKKGKSKKIHAIEIPAGASSIKEHRDKGMFAKRRTWYVVAMGDDKRWMVVYYGKKLSGHESLAVLSKSGKLEDADKAELDRLFKENFFLHAKSKKIKNISRP